MICLFLDDERQPSDVSWEEYPKEIVDFVVVKNYDTFCSELVRIKPAFVSFDHDIQDFDDSRTSFNKERTGYDAVKYLCNAVLQNELDMPVCIVHTKNPVGSKAITEYLKNFTEFTKKNLQ